jgi:hypothetical protein
LAVVAGVLAREPAFQFVMDKIIRSPIPGDVAYSLAADLAFCQMTGNFRLLLGPQFLIQKLTQFVEIALHEYLSACAGSALSMQYKIKFTDERQRGLSRNKVKVQKN